MNEYNGDHETVFQPEFSKWPELLQANRANAKTTSAILSLDEKQQLRTRVVKAARQFTSALDNRAYDAGIQISSRATSPNTDTLSNLTSIVMTGHQPTIFHPGIVHKYDATACSAQSSGAIALAVTIDTDSGDAGEILLPVDIDNRLRLEHLSLVTGPGLFLSQQLKTEMELYQLRAHAAKSLRNLGRKAESDCIANVMDQYARLAGLPIVEANAIMRRSLGIGSACLEVPLSTILDLPESQKFFAAILADARHFSRVYNKTLQAYRMSRKIRNHANPFPDLRRYDGAVELPFWVIDLESGERAPLFVEPAGESLRLSTRHGSLCELPLSDIANYTKHIGNKQLIAPRGPLITAFLRIALSDLFVHGTGGGKYDRFTDEFIHAYWSVKPPAFTVASATQYLFAQHRKEAHKLKEFDRELREMTSHVDRYFGTGTFSQNVESELRDIVAARTEFVESLKQAKRLRQPVADIGRTIKKIDAQIDSAIRQSLAPRIAQLQQLTSDQIRIYDTRGFPYFYFLHPPNALPKAKSPLATCRTA